MYDVPELYSDHSDGSYEGILPLKSMDIPGRGKGLFNYHHLL